VVSRARARVIARSKASRADAADGTMGSSRAMAAKAKATPPARRPAAVDSAAVAPGRG
jgi:hypothetical protein